MQRFEGQNEAFDNARALPPEENLSSRTLDLSVPSFSRCEEFSLSRKETLAEMGKQLKNYLQTREPIANQPTEEELLEYLELMVPGSKQFSLRRDSERGWRLEFELGSSLLVSGAIARYDIDSAFQGRALDPDYRDLGDGVSFYKKGVQTEKNGAEIISELESGSLIELVLLLEENNSNSSNLKIRVGDFDAACNEELYSALRECPGLYSILNIGQHLRRNLHSLLGVEIARRWPEMEKALEAVPTNSIRRELVRSDQLFGSMLLTREGFKEFVSGQADRGPNFFKLSLNVALYGVIAAFDLGILAKSRLLTRDRMMERLREEAQHCSRVNAPGAGWRIAAILGEGDYTN